MKLNKQLLMLFTVGICFNAKAEIEFSGYGSLIMGRTLGTVQDPLAPGQERDEILTADFDDVGQYSNDWSFDPETVLALQAKTKLTDELTLTSQLVVKGVNDYSPQLEWFYLTYEASSDANLMVGRRAIPMYYFSEFSEIGFAYPWMRPPSNLYWWPLTQFNGITYNQSFELSSFTNSISLFWGEEYREDNPQGEFYDRLFGGDAISVEEHWKNIKGLNWTISNHFIDLRLVYFTNDKVTYKNYSDGTRLISRGWFKQTFFGVGGRIDLQPVTILFDWNDVKFDDPVGTSYPTYLISLSYSLGDYEPYVVYSKADHTIDIPSYDESLEEHYIRSFGLRYNLDDNVSVKFQYDQFRDQGPKELGWNYHENSDTITVGVDFIF